MQTPAHGLPLMGLNPRPKPMKRNTWAVYQQHDGCPTKVLYSHLTEETADEVAERMNDSLRDRGIPASVWTEPHHPQHVFVIAS